MLALVGDSSYNIPGVPKVGQKTAAKWLNEYSDLDGVIKNADLIKGVVGDNLRNSLSELDRNVELVSLKDDVDLNVKFEDLLTLNPNQEQLDKIFKELEFAPMNKDKDDETPKKNGKYETILNKKDLNSWINKIKKSKAFAIDTETDSVQTVSANMLAFQHTGLAVVLQGLVRPRLRGTELEFWRNSEEARTDRPSQQLRSLNGEWRLMRYFLLTHLCGISHRIWCTLSTICSDAA
jgi:5''-3'' exonuclease (including N-terminal domain of PolI)